MESQEQQKSKKESDSEERKGTLLHLLMNLHKLFLIINFTIILHHCTKLENIKNSYPPLVWATVCIGEGAWNKEREE